VLSFEVDNVRTSIVGADQWTLNRLYEDLSFLAPSAPAILAEAGEILPLPTGSAIDEAEHRWDGKHRFLHRPKTIPPWFPTGLLPRAIRSIAVCGIPFRVADIRVRPELNADVPRYLNRIPLFDFQEEAVVACERAGRGVVVAAPRAGKTRILLELFRRLDLPALLIAPTTGIRDQTAQAAADWFHPSDILKLDGPLPEDAARARLWVATAGKVIRMSPGELKSRQVIFLDEFHHYVRTGAWGREIQKLCSHVYYWFGATGTHFRSGGDDMAMEAVLSGVCYEITSAELLKRGRLVPTHVVFMPVEANKLRGVGSDFITGFGKFGIHEHEYRNKLAVAATLHLYNSGRTALVIVGTKAQGHAIVEELRRHLPPVDPNSQIQTAEFLYRGRGGKSPEADMDFRKTVLESYNSRGRVRILIGTSVLGEGIDMPPSDALVWVRGEKAPVTLIQGWYRVCTAAEGKYNAVVVDFADRHHAKLLDHSEQRLNIACSDPVFRVSILPEPSAFGDFLASLPANVVGAG
jgi:superfamily II DNA or RNA helicase